MILGEVEVRYPCALLAALLMMGGTAFAQHGPPASGGVNAPTNPEGQTGGYMSQSDIQGLADFVDSTKRLEHKNIVSKALATKRATTMLIVPGQWMRHVAFRPTGTSTPWQPRSCATRELPAMLTV